MRVLLVSEGKHEESGALEALARRAAARITSCSWDRVNNRRIETQPGKGGAFFKRALRWILEARKSGFDALVLVIDEDGDRERIRQFAQAQQEFETTYHFPRALGIAIRSFDARILADEKALSDALRCAVQCQPLPEENRDPKADCVALRDASGTEIPLRDLYSEVAKRIDLERLAERCPKGFGVFAARLKSL